MPTVSCGSSYQFLQNFTLVYAGRSGAVTLSND